MIKRLMIYITAWCWNFGLYLRYPRAVWDFLVELHYLPNIVLPNRYNEKMFWRRVFDTDPAYATYCDKLAVRDVFARHAPGLKLAETVWIGDTPEDMLVSLFKQDVVVKTNNASSRMSRFPEDFTNREDFVTRSRNWLASPYKRWNGEWGYSQVKPLLFAERKVRPVNGVLEDIKVHLFGGKVFYSLIYHGEGTTRSRSAIFNEAGERLSVTNSLVQKDPARALPADYTPHKDYARAMEIACRIAAESDYLRVDFMHDGHELYGGEITVYPSGGRMTNSDPAVLAEMGRRWDLQRSWFMQANHSGWRARYQAVLREFFEDEAKLPASQA